jgi:dolichol-phosphate mannosyltransferase
VVRKLQSKDSNIYLLCGEKKGLGVAYIRGIKHCLSELDADVLFEMDADFSHNPKDVRRLIAEIDAGADFVIGSRYVPGGSIPREWGFIRRMNSKVGNIVARYVAGIYTIKDCTAGFRAIRTSVLKNIDYDTLTVNGYAFQVALLHEAVIQGARVKEIPVDFTDRTEDESKLSIRDIVEFIINAWWIRVQSLKTFIKFAIVGISGIIVNLGSFTLLFELGLNKYFASPSAIEISIISNFLLNNYWTFRSRRTASRVRIKGLKFNAVSLVAMGISYSAFVTLSLLIPTLEPQVCQLIGIVPAVLINYFMNSYWTFRHVPETICKRIDNFDGYSAMDNTVDDFLK